MSEKVVSTRNPLIFLIASLVVLFAPGVGDYRWVGFVAFLYIGLPWYILSVKDKVERKASEENYQYRRFKVQSLTILVFGLICAFCGVAIDLFILYQAFSEPTIASIGGILLRLFIGVPFFGFGAYLIYLSLGLVNNET